MAGKTPQKYLDRMNGIKNGKPLNGDEYGGSLGEDGETKHIMADKILCEFLRELGYGDLVDIYDHEDFEKWYA